MAHLFIVVMHLHLFTAFAVRQGRSAAAKAIIHALLRVRSGAVPDLRPRSPMIAC